MAATAEANTSTQDPIDMGISKDPFAAHRSPGDDPFASQRDEDALGDLSGSPPSNVGSPADRRMSKEWDASKVPPSRFQKREGSIYGTPASRDGHIKGSERDKSFHEKLKSKAISNLLSFIYPLTDILTLE